MSSFEKNLEIVEKIGFTKTRQALEELCQKTGPEENLRPVLDRAYEMGFVADEGGAMDFPEPITLGGFSVDYIIDLEGVKPGASEEYIPEEETGGETEELEFSTMSNLNPADSYFYRWTDWYGNEIRDFGYRMPMTSPIRNRSGVRLVGFSRSNCMGRTEYWFQTSFTTGYWHWSPWRRGGTTGVFNGEVTARRHQQQYR